MVEALDVYILRFRIFNNKLGFISHEEGVLRVLLATARIRSVAVLPRPTRQKTGLARFQTALALNLRIQRNLPGHLRLLGRRHLARQPWLRLSNLARLIRTHLAPHQAGLVVRLVLTLRVQNLFQLLRVGLGVGLRLRDPELLSAQIECQSDRR